MKKRYTILIPDTRMVLVLLYLYWYCIKKYFLKYKRYWYQGTSTGTGRVLLYRTGIGTWYGMVPSTVPGSVLVF